MNNYYEKCDGVNEQRPIYVSPEIRMDWIIDGLKFEALNRNDLSTTGYARDAVKCWVLGA